MREDGDGGDASPGLAGLLRARTEALHRRAERSGVVRAMLRGRVEPPAYALLLRNLLPVYEAMEAGLARQGAGSRMTPFTHPALARAPAIRADLEAIAGPDAGERLALLPAGARYTRRVAEVSNDIALLGHAYTRYLGDLSGGQILGRVLAHRPGLAPGMLTFYRFPGIDDPARFVDRCRAALDDLCPANGEIEAVVREAEHAFALNIELSLAVEAAADPGRR